MVGTKEVNLQFVNIWKNLLLLVLVVQVIEGYNNYESPDEVTTLIASAIRNGNIIKAVSHFQLLNDGSMLPGIINKAYTSKSNIENILKFLRGLVFIEHQSVGYSDLFTKMTSKNHLNSHELMILAFNVKEIMELPNFYKASQESRNKFEFIKTFLPSNVKNFVWSNRERCTIKNVDFGEYLYVADGNHNYELYTWIPTDHDTYWKYFQINKLDDAGYFSLKHVEKNRYLAISDDFDNNEKERRYVKSVSGGSKSDMKWRLIPERGYFIIKDYNYDGFFYASAIKKDRSRRYVYTWTTGNFKEMYWEINC